MADNVTLDAGSGGDTIAADDVSGVKYQLVQLVTGSDGGAKTLVTGLNGLPVNDAGTSLTVDGSVTISGTVAVTDNSSSLTVDNNGTFVVQENGGALTSLQLIDNLVLAEDAAHVSGDAGVQALAVRNDSDTSLAGTTGDYTPLQVDSNGYLKVNIKAGAGSGGTASTDDAAFTAASGSGTPMMGFVTADSVDAGDVGVVGMLANRQLKVTLYNSSGVEQSVGGGTQYTEGDTDATIVGNAILWEDAADTLRTVSAAKPLPVGDAGGTLTVDAPVGTPVFVRLSDGASAITTLPVSLASVPSHAVTNAGTFVVQESGAALTALQLIDDPVIADDSAFTPATSKVMVAGFTADETATDSVDEGDAGAARMTLDRKQIVSQYAHTAGGWTPYKLNSAGTTNATSLKGSAGQVGFVVATNTNASARYLKFYNKATSPTVGSDTPILVLAIPGSTSGGGLVLQPSAGIYFDTGIAFALVTGAGDSNSSAVAADEVIVNIGYK